MPFSLRKMACSEFKNRRQVNGYMGIKMAHRANISVRERGVI